MYFSFFLSFKKNDNLLCLKELVQRDLTASQLDPMTRHFVLPAAGVKAKIIVFRGN